MTSRRKFLSTASAALILPNALSGLLPRSAFGDDYTLLRAGEAKLELLEDKAATALWGFNGSTPGPTLRVKKGQRLKARFENGINQESAVHWHGIRIDNAMDGVPGLTQSAVKPDQEFLYDFVAPDAGTYWYHSHNRSWEQVARGLYGALIVEEENPPAIDHDLVVFVDDWRLNKDGTQAGDFDSMHDRAHAGRLGNIARTIIQGQNSKILQGQRIRLRLINVATDRIFPLEISGIEGKIVALDGMPLVEPAAIEKLMLAPAQRIDIIADILANEVDIEFHTNEGLYRLGRLTTEGRAEQRTDSKISALEQNRVAPPDLKQAIEVPLTMQGGAMSNRMMSGEMTADTIWAFNNISGLTDQPLKQFKTGQTALINMVNDTRFPHAIHLHGHHFQVLDEGELSSPRDTIVINGGKAQKIACVFDNPGKWLLHCHMLSHQATGMKTWVEVTA